MKNSKEKVYVKYDELLPERAFGYLSTTGELIMVKKGVMGYFRREDLDNYTADQLNDVLKVTKAQAEAMVHGSKFGWDVQVSDPRFWEDLARKKVIQFLYLRGDLGLSKLTKPFNFICNKEEVI